MIAWLRRRMVWKEAARWYARMAEPASSAEVAAFEKWLASHPAHARAYAEMDAVMHAAGLVPLKAFESRRPGPQFLRPALALGLAALAMATVILLSQGTATPAFAAISNDGASVREIRLADGTRVSMDIGAQIGVRLAGKRRDIAVQAGRVRIDPAADPRPLEVTARGSKINPGGTRLDVTVSEGELTVAALDGPLTLGSSAFATVVPNMQLEKGHAVVLGATGSRAAEADTSWPAGRVRFDGAPLSQIIARANRQGDPDLVAADADIAALRVSGVFDLRDTRRLARKLAAAFDLKVSPERDRLVLRR